MGGALQEQMRFTFTTQYSSQCDNYRRLDYWPQGLGGGEGNGLFWSRVVTVTAGSSRGRPISIELQPIYALEMSCFLAESCL